MIDYTQFGAQTMGPLTDEQQDPRRVQQRAPTPVQQPAQQPMQQPAQQVSGASRAMQRALSPVMGGGAAGQLSQTFAQLQAQGVPRPAPPPQPAPNAGAVQGAMQQLGAARTAQAAPSPVAQPNVPAGQQPNARGQYEYSTTGGVSVRATPQEAQRFGANADKPADTRQLYSALQSFNTTMPNYGRDPQQVAAALRSGDPQLRAMALEAVKQLDPESAVQVLNDQEFESIFGIPKAATSIGARLANEESLRRNGRSIVGLRGENGAYLTPGGAFGNAGYAPELQAQIAQLLGGQQGGQQTGGPMMANGAGSPFAQAPNPQPNAGPAAANPVAQTATGGSPGGPQTGGMSGQIQQILSQLLGNPTAYGTDAMRREFEAGARGIDDEFNQRQALLKEEMARRGLSDSSIYGGRMSDLHVGQRSAEQNLMESLLTKRADRQDDGIRSALAAAMGFDSDQRNFGESRRQFDESLGFDRERYQGDSQFRDKQFDADEAARRDAFLRAWYELFGGVGY